MQRGLCLVSLLLVTAFSGCLEGFGSFENDVYTEPERSVFEAKTLFLAPDGSLQAAPAETGSIPAGDFVLRWTTGEGAHPQLAHEPDNTTLLSPTGATATLWVTTDQPVFSAWPTLPDVAVWLGTGHHLPLVGSTLVDGPLLPDQAMRVEVHLAAHELQPEIQADQIDLLVTVTMAQLESHNVRILTGPEHPSQVNFIAATVPEPLEPAAALSSRSIDGTLPLFDRVVGTGPQGVNHADHPIQIADADTRLLIEVAATGGGHTVDMDMMLLDPAGNTITWGPTPYSFEEIRLDGDGLEPYRGKVLTLRVFNHLGVQMEYEGTIQQG